LSSAVSIGGPRLARSGRWTRRQDHLGDEKAKDDEPTGDEREPIHDAKEQQQADDRRDLYAAAQCGRSRALPTATVIRWGSQEQQCRDRAAAHRDGGDHDPDREWDLRIDEEDRADGDERARDRDEREKAPDR